jgi:hypothetical protein
MDSTQLLALSNFLDTELVSLAHSARYFYAQYENTSAQLSEVTRIRAERLDIGQPGSSAPAQPAAGPSGSTSA